MTPELNWLVVEKELPNLMASQCAVAGRNRYGTRIRRLRCLRPCASGWIAEKGYEFVGRPLLLPRTAKLVTVNASLTAKRMAMMMVTNKTKPTKTLKAADLLLKELGRF
jgi:hypothetical protein